MTSYVALLRAVNVGGTGKLLMSDLVAICQDAGFANIKTQGASGNVVFLSAASPSNVKRELEARLQSHAGKAVGVVLRTVSEMRAILEANPFKDTEPSYTQIIFLDEAPPNDALDRALSQDGEQMRIGEREIFVYYPNGMGRSKLRIPAAKAGTWRNINTVAKLTAMASK